MLLWAFFELLLVHYSTQTQTIEAECRTNVSLPCNAEVNSKKYLFVTWYKNSEQQHGILRRTISNSETRFYKFSRKATFGEKNSLFLPNVTPEDSGTYECSLSANVGGQNRNLFVTLNVSECVTEPEFTTMATGATVLNMTDCTHEHGSQSVQDLPLMWSVIGYGALGLTKIFLSMLIIWVVHIWSRRKRRW